MNVMKDTLLLLTKPREFFLQQKNPGLAVGLVAIIVLGFLSTLFLPKNTADLNISESLIGVLYVVQGLMAVLSVLVTVVLMTVFTWIVMKIFQGQLTFGIIFRYNVILYIPIALGMVWSALVTGLKWPGILNLNLVGGAMNNATNSVLYNLGRRIDLFSLWSVFVLFVFFNTGLDLDKKKATIATVLVWLLINIPPAIFFN